MNNEYTFPTENFTIYGKNGCHFCIKAKHLLSNKNIQYDYINCDEWLFDDKSTFLNFLKVLGAGDVKTFPVIFNNKVYVGGYTELEKYLFDENEKIYKNNV